MKDKHLVEALRTYENPLFDWHQKMTVVTHENGKREAISIHLACKMAADEIEQRDIDAENFRWLLQQMKRFGYGGLYKHLMGEDMPE